MKEKLSGRTHARIQRWRALTNNQTASSTTRASPHCWQSAKSTAPRFQTTIGSRPTSAPPSPTDTSAQSSTALDTRRGRLGDRRPNTRRSCTLCGARRLRTIYDCPISPLTNQNHHCRSVVHRNRSCVAGTNKHVGAGGDPCCTSIGRRRCGGQCARARARSLDRSNANATRASGHRLGNVKVRERERERQHVHQVAVQQKGDLARFVRRHLRENKALKRRRDQARQRTAPHRTARLTVIENEKNKAFKVVCGSGCGFFFLVFENGTRARSATHKGELRTDDVQHDKAATRKGGVGRPR